jgi:hypothetical protein
MFDYAVRKAKELADQYWVYALPARGSRKCEKQFLWTCGEFARKIISIRYLPPGLPHTAMAGTFIKTADRYDILLLPDLAPESERFVVCKELFHIVFDHEMSYNMNLLQHLDLTLFGNFEGGPLPQHVVYEYATHAAAAEFLLPHEDRLGLIAAGRQNDLAGIARQYDIPQVIVEHYLTDRAIQSFRPEA